MTTSLATPTLSLTPASDTGVSHSDGVTDDAVPVFYGTASPGALVTLTDATSGLSVTARADKYGNYIVMFAGLETGAHALTASSMDAAGNVSPTSNPYNIDIETQASATSTAPLVSETADSVNFQVHFDQPVSAVTPASFMLVTTGNAYGNVETVTGSGEDYTVTVAGLGGTGNVGLAFNADDAPTDLAGNEIALASDLHEVADTTAGATTLVSADAATGTQHAGAAPAVSGGGRVVAFLSRDGTLVPGSQTGTGLFNLYVKDLQTGAVVQVTNGNDQTRSVQISADGSTIAFSSMATDLIPGGTAPDQLNLYVAKLNSALSAGGLSLVPGSIQLIGKLDDAVPLELDGDGFALSGDGSTLAWQGDSTTPGAPIEDNIDYLTNLQTGTQTEFATGGDITSISLDGTRVAYEAVVDVPGTGGEPNPIEGGTFPPNVIQDAFVYDAASGTSITIDGSGLLPGTNPPLGPGEEPDYLTAYPVLSGDGSTVVFQLQRDAGQISLFSVNLANPSVFSPVSPGAGSDGGTDDDFDQSVSQGGGVIAYTSVDTTGGYHLVIDTPSTHTSTALSGGGFDPVLTTQGNAVVYVAPADPSDPSSEDLVYETTLGVSASIAPIDGNDAVDAAELKQAAKSGLAASGTTDAPAGSAVLLFVLPAVAGAVRSPSFNGIVGDDGTWTATIPASVAASLTDGTYALFVQVLDAVGASAKTSRVFTVDTVAPAQPVIPHLDPGSAAGLGQNGTPVTNTAMPTIDGVTDPLSLVSLYADVAGTIPVAVASARADQNGLYSITAPRLGDGIQDLEVQAVDPAGNPSPFSSSLEIIVDTTPPDPPPTPTLLYYSDSPDGPVTDVPRLSVIGTAEPGSDVTLVDAITGDVLTTDVVVGADGTYAATTHELSDGKYAVAAYATDLAGNVGKPSQYGADVTIDTQAPDAPTIESVSGGTASDGSLSPSLDISGEAEPFSQVALLVDGAPDAIDPAVTADEDGAFDLPTAGLPAGAHTLTVTATDFAGNVSEASAPKTVTISGAPVLPPGAPPETAMLNGTVVDGPISGATVFADTNGNGVRDPDEGSTVTGTDGRFTLADTGGELIASGGTDASTGLANAFAFTAPAGSTVITPLTTLLDAYAMLVGKTPQAAEPALLVALGLAAGTDLATLDPVAAATPDNYVPLQISGKIIQTLTDFYASLAGAGVTDLDRAAGFTAIAKAIEGLPPGVTLNFDDVPTLQAIFADVAGVDATEFAGVATQIATVAAYSNQVLDSNLSLDGISGILSVISQSEQFAEGTVAKALLKAGDDPASVQAVDTQYTYYPTPAPGAGVVSGLPTLAQDGGVSGTDNSIATSSAVFTGSALPGGLIAIVQMTGYATPGYEYVSVIGTGTADATGHYSIQSTLLPGTVSDLDEQGGEVSVTGAMPGQGVTYAVGQTLELPVTTPAFYVVVDSDDAPAPSITSASIIAAPGDDADGTALYVYGQIDSPSDDLTIDIYADGGTVPVGSTSTAFAGTYTGSVIDFGLTTTKLSAGHHVLTVTATLAGGTVVDGQGSFDVDVQPTALTDGVASGFGAIADGAVSVTTTPVASVGPTAVPTVETGAAGGYTVEAAAAGRNLSPVTLTGGYDTLTGVSLGGAGVELQAPSGLLNPIVGTLQAPLGSSVLTPLTSLVAALEADGYDEIDANKLAVAGLGLSPGLDLTTLDPLAAAEAGNTAPLLATVKLLDTVTLLAPELGFTFAPIADYIAKNGSIDLDSAADVTAALQYYATKTPELAVKIEDAYPLAAVVAASNAAITAHAADAASLADTLSYATAASVLAQQSETAAVFDEVNPPRNTIAPAQPDFSSVIAAYTGDDLETAIAAQLTLSSQATSFVPAGPLDTAAASVTFVLTFAQPVTGLSAADFSVVEGAGLSDAHVTGIAAAAGSSGAQYDVTVSTGVGTGSLAISFNGEGILSAAGEPLSEALLVPPQAGPEYLYSYDAAGPVSLTTGDFNGDGKLDVVAADFDELGPNVTVFLGNGDGAFSALAPTSPELESNTLGVVSGDFNGDGKRDLLVIGQDANDGSVVSFLAGNGDGTFQPAMLTSVPDAYLDGDAVVGDFNGDGKPDVAIGTVAQSPHTVAVLLGVGDGTFDPVYLDVPDPGAGAEAGFAIASADVNGDGIPDLLVLTNLGVSVFLGQATGGFNPVPGGPFGQRESVGAATMAVGDLNGDGKPDVAIDDPSGVELLFGKGDGTFSAPVALPIPPQLQDNFGVGEIAIGDLNGDGDNDIVLSSEFGVSVLDGHGDGTFSLADQTSVSATAGLDTTELVLADVDGDGRPDVIAPSGNLGINASGEAGLEVLLDAPEPVQGSTSEPVTVDRPSVADPVLTETSGGGTFTHSGNAYTLNLGTLAFGAAATTVFSLANAAAAPADRFDGTFSTPTGSGFALTGASLAAAIAAGQSQGGITFTADTDTPGSHSETITFAPRDETAETVQTVALDDDDGTAVNLPGTPDPNAVAAELPALTLTVTDTVTAAIAPTGPAVLAPVPAIVLPNVRIGGSDTQALTIANSAAIGSANLDVTATDSGSATVSGSVAGLAPQASDDHSLVVGINTSAAGAQSGTVALAPVSEPDTVLATDDVAVSGNVYREATASITPVDITVHVGDPDSAALQVSNTDAPDGFSEALIASITGVTTGLSIASTGPTADIAAGSGDTSSLAVGFSTATAGTITGTATLGLASDGGTGAGSIDGLGQVAENSVTAPISVQVNNHAVAELTSGNGVLTPGSDPNTFTLDLGNVQQNSSPVAISLDALNAAVGPADDLGGSFTISGGSDFTNTGFGMFSGVGAGSQSPTDTVALDTGTPGDFSETIVLNPTGSNSAGYSEVLQSQTVTVTGTVVPPQGSAIGDVHMLTFDGLHYNFQEAGDFTLAQSTVAGNSFDIQAHMAMLPGVSIMTEAAAKVGNTVVAYTEGSGLTINGVADTALSAQNPMQLLGGGEIKELAAGSYQVTWATGESMTMTDAGFFLDVSATLGPNDGPGSVQGLMGSDSGQANDFALADGTVLKQPLTTAQLLGEFADAWRVAPAQSLLGDTIGASSGAPPPMTFLSASGPGQVLTGSQSSGGTAGPAVTMLGTLADLAGDIIANFASHDLIDITNVSSAQAAISYTGSTTAGDLLIAAGASTATVHVSGSLAGGAFHTASDQHGGTLISVS